MNFTNGVTATITAPHSVTVLTTAVQCYDSAPTSVFSQMTIDGRLVCRNKIPYCDMRASDALLKDLPVLLRILDKCARKPTDLTIVFGNLLAYTYLTGQAPPPTNTTQTLVKSCRKAIKHACQNTRLVLRPDAKEFEQYKKFVVKHYDKSRIHPCTGKIQYVLEDVRKETGQ